MSVSRCRNSLAVASFALLLAAPSTSGADRAAAEREYRVARRLAAQGSAEAMAVLQKVVELDPAGPLADDALVDLAVLLGAPQWIEEQGRVSGPDAAAATAVLREAVDIAGADRADEARYRLALLQLEPLPGADASAARRTLAALATSSDAGDWGARARYAAAVLNERAGDASAALGAYTRIFIDHPNSAVAARAAVGQGRVLLRNARAGLAADWLQRGIDAGAPDDVLGRPLREAALRTLLAPGEPSAADAPRLVATATGVRNPIGLSALADGGAIVGDRRTGSVLRLDAGGVVVTRWEVPGLTALASDAAGRAYAADATGVMGLRPDGSQTRVAALGDHGPASALAVDGGGSVWLLDKKGTRVSRVDAVEVQVVPVYDAGDVRWVALVADGPRLLALEGKSGAVFALEGSAPARRILTTGFDRPTALAVDPAGRIAILDGRDGAVALHRGDGSPLGVWSSRSAGLVKAVAFSIGPDGAWNLFDGDNESWWRSP